MNTNIPNRRQLLQHAIAVAGITASQSKASSSSGTRNSPDLLAEVRRRFPARVHPDVQSVWLFQDASSLNLVMVVSPNAAWAGAFHDFDHMHSCSRLTVTNELLSPTRPTAWGVCLASSVSTNARRLLLSDELECLCQMIGLISRENAR